MNDQRNKADGGKILPRLLIGDMPDAVSHVSAVLSYGAEKYEERGWREVDPARYEDALLRHYLEYRGGQLVDKESGIHHLAHLACNVMFMLQLSLEDLASDGYPQPLKWNHPPQHHKTG